MAYPNRAQWIVIWLAWAAASWLWYHAYGRIDEQEARLPVILIIGAVLLVWQLSRRTTPP